MNAPEAFPYATYLDVKFAQCKDRWYNQSLC